jgi:hypothetical protein
MIKYINNHDAEWLALKQRKIKTNAATAVKASAGREVKQKRGARSRCKGTKEANYNKNKWLQLIK